MSFSAKLTLLICVTASFLSNCSFGENLASHNSIKAASLNISTIHSLSFGGFYAFSKHAPLSAETLYEIALKTRVTDRDAAEDLVKEAIRLKPDFVEAIYALSWIGSPVIRCGGYTKIELETTASYSKKAITLKPTLFSAQDDLVKSLIGLGRHQEAKIVFDQMRFLRPETVDDQIDFARVHWSLGRINEAIWHFERAIKLINTQLNHSPDDAIRAELCSTQIGVYHVLSGLYFEIGDRKKAEQYFSIRDH